MQDNGPSRHNFACKKDHLHLLRPTVQKAAMTDKYSVSSIVHGDKQAAFNVRLTPRCKQVAELLSYTGGAILAVVLSFTSKHNVHMQILLLAAYSVAPRSLSSSRTDATSFVRLWCSALQPRHWSASTTRDPSATTMSLTAWRSLRSCSHSRSSERPTG